MSYIDRFVDSLASAENALNKMTSLMGQEWAVRSALSYMFFCALELGDIEDWKEHHAGHQLLMEMYDRIREIETEL